MKNRDYQRLPGRGRRGGFIALSVATPRCTLWLGKDHLLAIEQQGYREDYKRFYYRDIQALVIRRTAKFMVVNIGLIMLLAGFGVLAVLAGPAAHVPAGILAGTVLALLALNGLGGPTCSCYLRTAVHTEDLPSIKRLRTARKIVQRIRPLLAAAQGIVTPEDLQAAAAAPTVAIPLANKKSRPIRHERGRVHAALFTTLLVSAGWYVVDYYNNHVAITLVGGLCGVLICILTIYALARQGDTDLPKSVRGCVWCTLGCVCWMFVVGYIEFILIVVKHPKVLETEGEILMAFVNLSAQNSILLGIIYLVSIIASAGLGLAGFLMLCGHWRRQKQVGQTAPPSLPPAD